MALPSEGFTPSECFDFDLAVLHFHQWEEGRKHETKWARRNRSDDPPGNGKNFKQVPRYESMADVWGDYYGEPQGIDPDVAAISDADLQGMLGDWTMEQEDDPWANL